MQEVVYENCTAVTDEVAKDIVAQYYHKAKAFVILRYVFCALGVLLGIYYFLQKMYMFVVFFALVFPAIIILLFFYEKRKQVKTLMRTFDQLHPNGQLEYVFMEDKFGYRDGRKYSYSQVTNFVERDKFWLIYMGDAVLSVSKTGFSKGSAAKFGDFFQSRFPQKESQNK